MYFLIFGLLLLTIELTWAITDKLENDKIKLIMLNFRLMDILDAEINLHPFVNSILPKNKLYKVPDGNLTKFSKISKAVLI